MPLPVGVAVPDNRVNVLLPVGYEDEVDLAYPVLYLLHGAGDTWSSWIDQTDLAELAGAFALIVVMPDGGHQSQATWYSDWSDGTWQAESYVTSVLPAFVESRFRCRPGPAAIAGLSMGGFGAMSLAARHPGRYRAAASLSGVLDTLRGAPESGRLFAELNAEYGTPDARVWGEQSADRESWAEHNPASLAGRLRDVELFVACGAGTPGGFEGESADGTAYVLEAGVRDMNLAFVSALQAAGVAARTDLYAGGYHGWPYWRAGIRWVLPQLAAILGPPEARPPRA